MADVTGRLDLVHAVLARTPEHGSVTAGIAIPESDDSAESLIAWADAGLYRERQQGSVSSSSAAPPPDGRGSIET